MAVTTLGQAFKMGWRLKVRCHWFGPQKRSDRVRPWCDTRAELDLKTLLWTRGEDFPLELLQSRLKCPRCGGRKVIIVFEAPSPGKPAAARADR
jgi:hypothetical protein